MPSHWWDYIHIHRTEDEDSSSMGHDLQAGLLQIASQTCNILVQVNNTNNISYGQYATHVTFNEYGDITKVPRNPFDGGCEGPSTSRSKSKSVRVPAPRDKVNREQTRELLSKRETFIKRNSKLFADYKQKLTVSGNFEGYFPLFSFASAENVFVRSECMSMSYLSAIMGIIVRIINSGTCCTLRFTPTMNERV